MSVHYLERDTHLSTTWSVPDVAVGAPFNLRSTNVVPWLNKSLAISLCLLNLPDCCLGEVPRMMFGVAERGKIPHVVRFVDTIVNQPAIKSIFEGAVYVEKARQYVPPPKEKKETKA